jgi:hypothetical protein
VTTWNSYFDRKWTEAVEAVTQADGHPYTWSRAAGHQVWASLWAGLGDFDTTHGYKWDDNAINAYASGPLAAKYDEHLPWWFADNVDRSATDFFDADRLYYRHPLQTPHFLDVLRDKVIHDVTTDPLWYLSILGRRAWRVLTETTPATVYLSPAWQLRLPFTGLLTVFVLMLAVVRRHALEWRLLLCALPLSLTPMLIYSGGFTPYYSVYHLCGVAIALTWLADAALRRMARASIVTTAPIAGPRPA